MEDNQHRDQSIVGDQSLDAAELSVIENIKPDGEQQHPRYGGENRFQHQQEKVQCCE